MRRFSVIHASASALSEGLALIAELRRPDVWCQLSDAARQLIVHTDGLLRALEREIRLEQPGILDEWEEEKSAGTHMGRGDGRVTCEEDLHMLTASGYACVSRAHGTLSRIDRPDWREHMATKWGGTTSIGMKSVLGMGDRAAADHYRRCYSEDSIVVGNYWAKLAVKSADGPLDYVDLDARLKR